MQNSPSVKENKAIPKQGLKEDNDFYDEVKQLLRNNFNSDDLNFKHLLGGKIDKNNASLIS